jgi:hypothetical protein
LTAADKKEIAMRLVTFGVLAGVLFCAWFAWAAPDQESDQMISKVQQEMIDAAGEAYEASAAMYDVGAGDVTLEGVYTWSRRWADAAPKGEQLKAYTAHRDRMKNLLAKVKAKFETGLAGGTKDRYAAARYYAAEADYLLLKMTSDAK